MIAMSLRHSLLGFCVAVAVAASGTAQDLLAVKAGKMAATIAQNPALMGRTAVERAVALLKGESVPADIGVSIELVK